MTGASAAIRSRRGRGRPRFLAAGALTSTFTASQGLLLMIPNMYKMPASCCPAFSCDGPFRCRPRPVHLRRPPGCHGRAPDRFWAAGIGFGPGSHGPGLVAHLSAIEASVPFLHFFDGFRTSHEIQKIEMIDYADMAKPGQHGGRGAFRARGPTRSARARGTAQNPDIYFQGREAANPITIKDPGIVADYMKKVGDLTGRATTFSTTWAIPMPTGRRFHGVSCETIEEVVNYLTGQGEKVGLVKVRLYRPFSPSTCSPPCRKQRARRITVLDRTKEPGALGDPLYLDVCTALHGSGRHARRSSTAATAWAPRSSTPAWSRRFSTT
jgi:pyruvate-ferredoxin/flavodoxin oxidoreductase